jgi:hypothetical protein
MSLASRADWLYGVRPLIHRWIGEQCRAQHQSIAPKKPSRRPSNEMDSLRASEKCTEAYADLTLAFGLALTGSGPGVCRQLVDEARQLLDLSDGAHGFLARAYEYRIQQALDGHPGKSALSAELLEGLAHLDRPFQLHANSYIVNRLRSRSEILEPEGGVDPYRQYATRTKGAGVDLSSLCDIASPVELADQIRRLMEAYPGWPPVERASVLRRCLDLSPRFEQSQAVDFLDRVIPLLGDLSDPAQRIWLIASALSATAAFGRIERARALAAFLHEPWNAASTTVPARAQDDSLRRSIHALRRLGLREELGRFLTESETALLRGGEVAAPRARSIAAAKRDAREAVTHESSLKCCLLYGAGGWLDLGRSDQSSRTLDEVPDLLRSPILEPFARANLARAYVRTLGRIPGDDGQRRAEDLLQWLGDVYDTFTTGRFFAQAPLMLVEALVLGMTAESCLMAPFPAPTHSTDR